MRVLVCVKRVPAPGAKIVLTDDAQSIDTSLLSFAVSPHEECAIEAGVRIAAAHDGSVTVLTLGPPEAEEQLRSALAVGAGAAVLIPTDGSDWDPISTATAISSAVEELEEEGPFDLILCRNVLLYFCREKRAHAFSLFAERLQGDGGLILGAGETVIGQTEGFASDRNVRGLYRKRENPGADRRMTGT